MAQAPADLTLGPHLPPDLPDLAGVRLKSLPQVRLPCLPLLRPRPLLLLYHLPQPQHRTHHSPRTALLSRLYPLFHPGRPRRRPPPPLPPVPRHLSILRSLLPGHSQYWHPAEQHPHFH